MIFFDIDGTLLEFI
ncbi:Protein of unknown function [Bacillus cereus]|nr:Protein of unknown function [Bacillus cereus]